MCHKLAFTKNYAHMQMSSIQKFARSAAAAWNFCRRFVWNFANQWGVAQKFSTAKRTVTSRFLKNCNSDALNWRLRPPKIQNDNVDCYVMNAARQNLCTPPLKMPSRKTKKKTNLAGDFNNQLAMAEKPLRKSSIYLCWYCLRLVNPHRRSYFGRLL